MKPHVHTGGIDVLFIFLAVLLAGIVYRTLAYYLVAAENERHNRIGQIMLFAY